MRRALVALDPEENLEQALLRLRLARMRGLPVVAAGRLVGEIGSCALHRLLLGEGHGPPTESAQRTRAMLALRAGGAMAAPRPGLLPDLPLTEVARRLAGETLGYLPVVSERGELLGIVTERDLLRAALAAAPSPPASSRTQP